MNTFSRLHDTNNDTKLDGLEIMAALNHMGQMFKLQPQERAGKTPEQIAALEEERQKGALKYFTGEATIATHFNFNTIFYTPKLDYCAS